MISTFHKMSLTKRIFISMGAALFIGIILNQWSASPDSAAFAAIDKYFINGFCYVIGKLFLNCLNMTVVPLVLVSLICGVIANGEHGNLGRISSKTFGLYLLSTGVAIFIALMLASIIKPGTGVELVVDPNFTPKEPAKFVDVLANIIPGNAIHAMAGGKMLQVIAFALIIGLAINQCGDAKRPIVEFTESVNTVMLKLIHIIMNFAPYGVFGLVTQVFREQGFSAFSDLAVYMLVILLGLLIHAAVTYTAIIAFIAKLNPITFFKKMIPAQLFGFSTASSSATIPVTMETCEEKLGVSNKVASFAIPLGATVNMDGTAIMQGVATVFIANLYGIDLSTGTLLAVIFTATLASVGTAGIPSAGMVTLTMVLAQANLPTEPIAMILGVDRLLDMIRTSVNITGDAAVTVAVARSEGELDLDIYNSLDEAPSPETPT